MRCRSNPVWRAAAWLLLATGAWLARAADLARENQVKAAFLYNFTKFVDWPSRCFAEASGPIVIGVMGDRSFVDELAQLVRERSVNGRPILVRPIRSAEDLPRLHVVFVANGEERRFETLLSGKTAGVLTVGESRQFAAMGGMITFVAVEDKERFEINITAAEAAGLKISAQLQKLALAVRRK